MKKICLILALSFCSSCGGLGNMFSDLYQNIPICVNDKTGNDSNTGRGWNNAVQTIAQAVTNADTGNEIWIAGSYTVTESINVSKTVSLYGGFKGNESRREERDLNSKTVINGSVTTAGYQYAKFYINSSNVIIDGFLFTGDAGGSSAPREIYVPNIPGTSVKNCDFIGNGTSSTLLELIFISNGEIEINNCRFIGNISSSTGHVIQASSGNVTICDSIFASNEAKGGSGAGAALYINNSSMSAANCVFTDNYATTQGGAIYSTGVSTVTLSNCRLTGNSASTAGALFFSKGTLVINDSYVCSNHSTNSAGGVCLMSGTGGAIDASVSGTILSSNYSSSGSAPDTGGGLYVELSAGGSIKLDISKSTISSNYAASTANNANGGGLYVTASASGTITVKISDTIISSNHASASASGSINALGGAVYSNAGASGTISTTLDRCFLSGNHAEADLPFGGAVYTATSGAGGTSEISLFNCALTGNHISGTTARGGALCSYNTTAAASTVQSYIYNCTLTGNTADGSTSGDGAALFAYSGGYTSTITAYNSVFYNNTASTGSSIYANPSSAVTFSNSAFNGNASGPFISVDSFILSASPFASLDSSNPEFLRPAKILVNRGTSYAGMTATDLEGNKRIVNGVIDIGAYERQ